jgi:uracil-DNA glycosylase
MWFEQMHSGWQSALADWKPFLNATEASVAQLPNLVPAAGNVMAAFQLDPELVRVLLVGQDPYPGEGMAVGRAFAVSLEVPKLPQSLRNIFSELTADLGLVADLTNPDLPSADLLGWQEQGVFLLNRHLTTTLGNPEAHVGLGWDDFTLAAVRHLLNRGTPPVLVLWGAHAQRLLKQLQIIDGSRAPHVVQSAHPSPLSAYRGFFGSKPFSQVNEALLGQGLEPIDWFR